MQPSLLSRVVKPQYITLGMLVLLVLLLILWWEQTRLPVYFVMPEALQPSSSTEPIQPIPLRFGFDARKVSLGKQLFYEPRLAGDNRTACHHCHNLTKGGADHRQYSQGVNGVTATNSLTVFNSRLNIKLTWNGQSGSYAELIDADLRNPVLMNSTWPAVIAKLNQDARYLAAFEELYADGITSTTISDALSSFLSSLTTPNARFDQYLRGDTKAITTEEKAGYDLFKTLGCVSCHQGVNVGGNLYQKFGIMRDYFANHDVLTPADLGRFTVTGDEKDRHVFRVPSLRNVELTAPYFHDGSAHSLEEAVQMMAHYQLGRPLSKTEATLIVQFLRTLTGNYEDSSS